MDQALMSDLLAYFGEVQDAHSAVELDGGRRTEWCGRCEGVKLPCDYATTAKEFIERIKSAM